MRKGKLNTKANTWKDWSNQEQCKHDLMPTGSRRALTYILTASLGCGQSWGRGLKQLSIRAASQTQHPSAPQSWSPFLAASAKNYRAPHPSKHLTLPNFTQKLVGILFISCWWLLTDYRDNTLDYFSTSQASKPNENQAWKSTAVLHGQVGKLYRTQPQGTRMGCDKGRTRGSWKQAELQRASGTICCKAGVTIKPEQEPNLQAGEGETAKIPLLFSGIQKIWNIF